MPLKYNRSKRALVEPESPMATNRELVGDKFADLAMHPKFLLSRPDIVGLSSGYFKNFLDSFGANGSSLRQLRDQMIREIGQKKMNSEELESRLEQFRKLVISANTGPAVKPAVGELFQSPKKRFPESKELSFCSSTDIEGVLNTAGLFSSFRLTLDSPSSLAGLFQDILVAMYTPRSFQIRRRRSVQRFFFGTQLDIGKAVRNRLYSKGEAELEFVLVPGKNGQKPKLVVLQFAVPLSLESAAAVLQGAIPKAKAFALKENVKIEAVDDFRLVNDFKSLGYFIENPDRMAEPRFRRRFAIVQKQEQPPEFIFWSDGILH